MHMFILCFFSASIFVPGFTKITQSNFEKDGKLLLKYDLLEFVNNIENGLATFLKDTSQPASEINNFSANEFSEKEDQLLDRFISKKITSKCLDNILYTLQSVRNNSSEWALKLIDSYGKPGSGITLGNTKWYGNYLQCLDVYAPPAFNETIGDFNGKYCLVDLGINFRNLTSFFTVGVCFPDICSVFELNNFYAIAKFIPELEPYTSYINITSLKCKENSKPLTVAAIGVLCLLCFFILLVVLGSAITLYEHFFVKENTADNTSTLETGASLYAINNQTTEFDEHNDKVKLHFTETSGNKPYFEFLKKCKPFLNCFCIFTNGSKLLSTNGTEGQLLCIHGMRFFSMCWVILGHTYSSGIQPADNPLQAAELSDNFAFQILFQAFYAVDSFFVLSGFLLTYLFMKEYTKNEGRMSWFYFYVHRYLRLTPLYMIVLGYLTTVSFFVGSGPYWPDKNVDPVCAKYWWANLLYINNFVKTEHQCMPWSWFLANDMQFFIISPLFLITIWRWPKIGFSLVALSLVGSCCANFYLTYHYDLYAGLSVSGPKAILAAMDKFNYSYDKIYIKPYTRIGPYLVGIITGYLLFKAKTTSKPKMNIISLLIGWIVASTVTLTIIYGLYHTNSATLANSFYNAVKSPLFGAGLCWVIYVCLTDQGGFINKLLSYSLFIPLSRLTYTAYLIHPLILISYFGSLKGVLTFSHPTMVIHFLGILVMAYAFSILVSLTFESPIIGLEKLVRKTFSTKRRVSK